MGSEEIVYVSILSNSRILSDGLASLLALHINIRVAGTYNTENFAIEAVPNPNCHLVLVDSGLGRDYLLALTQQCSSYEPPLHTVILEMADDIDLIMTCIEAGACGYTLRGACIDELIRVIVGVLHGAAYCDPEITARLFERLTQLRKQSGTIARTKVPLTSRELEVLHQIAKGFSNLEIAAKLNIEVRTVKHHVHNILDKLNLRRRWDAVRVATERGWLDATQDTRLPLHH